MEMEFQDLEKDLDKVKAIWKILNDKKALNEITQKIKIDYLSEKYKKRILKHIIRNTRFIIQDLKKDYYIKNWNDLYKSVYEYIEDELQQDMEYFIEDEENKFLCENSLDLMNITLKWKKEFFKDLKELDYETIIIEMEYKAWIDVIDSFITSLKNYIEKRC